MKIVTISDTHNKHREVEVPDGDVLVVAGDFTGTGTNFQIESFNDWLYEQPHEYKLVVAGNHDLGFEDDPYHARTYLDHCVYLQDSSIVINGIKFYGSPWQPEFCDWAFNLPRGEKLKDRWDRIPHNTDVLITHGPPHGILDSNIAPDDPRNNFGCEDLKHRVAEVKPTYHIFGHIHGSYGQLESDGTTYVNTCICDEEYNPTNKPHVLKI